MIIGKNRVRFLVQFYGFTGFTIGKTGICPSLVATPIKLPLKTQIGEFQPKSREPAPITRQNVWFPFGH